MILSTFSFVFIKLYRRKNKLECLSSVSTFILVQRTVFLSKDGPHSAVAPARDKLLVLTENIDWLPGGNALAYFGGASMTKQKKFYKFGCRRVRSWMN
jgi:hypothetical protein